VGGASLKIVRGAEESQRLDFFLILFLDQARNIYKFKNFRHFKTLINQLVLLNLFAFRLFEG
jgi:hypothetical protein